MSTRNIQFLVAALLTYLQAFTTAQAQGFQPTAP